MLKNQNYIDQLVFEMQFRNYSIRTINTYKSLLQHLAGKLAISLGELTTEQLKQYLHKRITEEGISISTVNQTISAFKILQTDVLKQDWESFKIKRPRREKKLPIVLSEQEVEMLISATINLKHRALLMIAYSAGLRLQEVQTLKPNAIDSSRMVVRVVQGKGKKDRYTLLSQKTLNLLREYYKIYRPQTYLFESQCKKGQFLSETTFSCIIKKNALKAGIKKSVSFHTLRHSFATHLLEHGINLKAIQQLMGHNSLKTTSVYLHIATLDPATIVSPLDQMNI